MCRSLGAELFLRELNIYSEPLRLVFCIPVPAQAKTVFAGAPKALSGLEEANRNARKHSCRKNEIHAAFMCAGTDAGLGGKLTTPVQATASLSIALQNERYSQTSICPTFRAMGSADVIFMLIESGFCQIQCFHGLLLQIDMLYCLRTVWTWGFTAMRAAAGLSFQFTKGGSAGLPARGKAGHALAAFYGRTV